MGLVFVKVKLRNPITNSEVIEIDAKIDTGATLLVLPGQVADKLQFPIVRKTNVKYANEKSEERNIVGGVEMEICGRKGWFEAVVEPAKSYALIGAVVMETLDLIGEPRDLKIYPNPRSPGLPMAEIE